jgi:hypothetical protein
MAAQITAPDAKEQIAHVDFEVRNIQGWLAHLVSEPSADRSTLEDIESRLRAQAQNLDAIDGAIRAAVGHAGPRRNAAGATGPHHVSAAPRGLHV